MKTAAVIGASADRSKWGNKAVRAFQRCGYTVYPVHPRELEIEGLETFTTISAVPVRPEIVSVYLSPPALLAILPAIAARGCDELWLNPGTDSPEVVQTARQLGLHMVRQCSLLALGENPSKY